MELLVKPEILTSYIDGLTRFTSRFREQATRLATPLFEHDDDDDIYGPTFGNAESRLFLFSAQCFNTESMHKVILRPRCMYTLCQLPRSA
jgi:hypothetical protein